MTHEKAKNADDLLKLKTKVIFSFTFAFQTYFCAKMDVVSTKVLAMALLGGGSLVLGFIPLKLR